jgi:CHASE1-domain containing sensor protein
MSDRLAAVLMAIGVLLIGVDVVALIYVLHW